MPVARFAAFAQYAVLLVPQSADWQTAAVPHGFTQMPPGHTESLPLAQVAPVLLPPTQRLLPVVLSGVQATLPLTMQ